MNDVRTEEVVEGLSHGEIALKRDFLAQLLRKSHFNMFVSMCALWLPEDTSALAALDDSKGEWHVSKNSMPDSLRQLPPNLDDLVRKHRDLLRDAEKQQHDRHVWPSQSTDSSLLLPLQQYQRSGYLPLELEASQVTLVDTVERFASFVAELRNLFSRPSGGQPLVIGIDCEWFTSCKVANDDDLGLIQIAIGTDRVVVIDVLALSDAASDGGGVDGPNAVLWKELSNTLYGELPAGSDAVVRVTMGGVGDLSVLQSVEGFEAPSDDGWKRLLSGGTFVDLDDVYSVVRIHHTGLLGIDGNGSKILVT